MQACASCNMRMAGALPRQCAFELGVGMPWRRIAGRSLQILGMAVMTVRCKGEPSSPLNRALQVVNNDKAERDQPRVHINEGAPNAGLAGRAKILCGGSHLSVPELVYA